MVLISKKRHGTQLTGSVRTIDSALEQSSPQPIIPRFFPLYTEKKNILSPLFCYCVHSRRAGEPASRHPCQCPPRPRVSQMEVIHSASALLPAAWRTGNVTGRRQRATSNAPGGRARCVVAWTSSTFCRGETRRTTSSST
jgi:hypothetical protein